MSFNELVGDNVNEHTIFFKYDISYYKSQLVGYLRNTVEELNSGYREKVQIALGWMTRALRFQIHRSKPLVHAASTVNIMGYK